MTGAEYDALARACDRLLRAGDASLARVALPLLHVINEHPALLGPYTPLFATENHRRPGPEVVGGGTMVLRGARALRRTMLRPQLAASALETDPTVAAVDVLIVSRAGSVAALTRTEDFYFGPLQRMVTELGATAWLALVDHLPEDAPDRASALRAMAPGRSLLPRRVSLRAELALWRRCVAARRALLSSVGSLPDPLERRLAMRAAGDLLAGAALANLRLHQVVLQLCRRLRPRIVLTTYEGDASERLIWHAARSASNSLCAGYQHVPLLPRAHAIRRAVASPRIACDPQVVLTLGETTRAALADSQELGAVRLLTYGSHRRPQRAGSPEPGQRAERCLVLPDAHPSESAVLFEFAAACAREMPAVRFVFRPHPSSAEARAGTLASHLRELPDNLEISTGTSFEEECVRARFCVYRGSSAALYAVLAGLKPFYLARSGELPFDPLAGLSVWRETIGSPRELAMRMSAPSDGPALEEAQAYCARYAAPLQPQAIEALLAMAAPLHARRATP